MPPKRNPNATTPTATAGEENFFGKDDIQEMVQRAVNAATKSLLDDFAKRIDKQSNRIKELESKQVVLDSENQQLKGEVFDLNQTIDNLKGNISSQSDAIQSLTETVQDCMRQTNKNEQYSRRNSLNIHGLKLATNQDSMSAVCDFFKNQLDKEIKVEEIVAAHIVPRRPSADGKKKRGAYKPPPILVKFAKKERRDEVIRKQETQGLRIFHSGGSNCKKCATFERSVRE